MLLCIKDNNYFNFDKLGYNKMHNDFFRGARIGITGVGGTIGQGLLKKLLSLDVELIRGMENNELALFNLQNHFENHKCLSLHLCDIRDLTDLTRMMKDLDYVFHTAAFKHVPFCEQNPFITVKTNIIGIENVIRAASRTGVKKVLFTSSDKAVNPSNVMGTSKLMGERLITAANTWTMNTGRCIYASSRFGNVVNSTGSVVSLFYDQISHGGPLTLTDPAMTRFVMTNSEACHLVIEGIVLAKGGEVFVTKMPVVKIIDIAEAMIELLAPLFGFQPDDIEIEIVGIRPGEKIFEELVSEEEVRRTLELNNMFAVTPAFKNIYSQIEYRYAGQTNTPADRIYRSDNADMMSKEQIRKFLLKPEVLGPSVNGLKSMRNNTK
jgi:FlaA1/EpsC-like NDP-sugar epimerase